MADSSETPENRRVNNLTLRQLIDDPDILLCEGSVSDSVEGARQNNDFGVEDEEIGHAACVLTDISSPVHRLNMARGTRSNSGRTDTNETEENNDNFVVETVEEDSEDEEEFSDPPVRVFRNSEADAFDNSYDTDGDEGPVNKTTQEEECLEDEQSLPDEPPVNGGTGGDNGEEEEEDNNDDDVVVFPAPPNAPVAITEEVLVSLTKPQLQEELRIRGVTFPSRYNKTELLDRLRQSLHIPVTVSRGALAPTSKSFEKTKQAR